MLPLVSTVLATYFEDNSESVERRFSACIRAHIFLKPMSILQRYNFVNMVVKYGKMDGDGFMRREGFVLVAACYDMVQ